MIIIDNNTVILHDKSICIIYDDYVEMFPSKDWSKRTATKKGTFIFELPKQKSLEVLKYLDENIKREPRR